jgi:hypothetical protein
VSDGGLGGVESVVPELGEVGAVDPEFVEGVVNEVL